MKISVKLRSSDYLGKFCSNGQLELFGSQARDDVEYCKFRRDDTVSSVVMMWINDDV